MSSRHAVVVINRKGSRGHSSVDPALRVLEEADIELTVHFCRDPGRIPRLVRERAGGADMVVLGGGDGTLSHALEAVLDAGRPLGILPMGNANDLARTLGIPLAFEEAAAVVARGKTRLIDLGWVNGKHFFNVASLGVSVRIADRLSGEIKRRWGVASYLICAWDAVRSTPSFTARVSCDDVVEELRTIQIAVGNGRHYGGGMTIMDDAAIDDGRLDLYSIPPQPFWKLMILLPALRWGKHRDVESVRTLHGQVITVTTDHPMPINVDGEVVTRTPAEFRVLPARLSVFAP